jgi:integrase
MSVTLRPRGDKWEYSIHFRWPDGTPFRERRTAPPSDKKAAKRWAELRELDLIKKGPAYVPPPATPVRKTPTLAEFWPRLIRDHYQANRKKPSTLDYVDRHFRRYLTPMHRKPIDQIGEADVSALKGAMVGSSPKQVNNVLGTLSQALKCAHQWGIIPRVLRMNLLPKEEHEAKWYALPEYARLVAGARRAGTEATLVVLLGAAAGLRRGEIVALQWGDLDLEAGEIHVRRNVWRDDVGTTKGGRSRRVPMSAELGAALRAHRHLRGDYVLCRDDGTRVTLAAIHGWLRSAQRLAGLEVDMNVHALRHTFCSHLAIAGVPAVAIQALAGHQNLVTTQRYMHLSPLNRGNAIDCLSEWRTNGTRGRRTGRQAVTCVAG